MKPLDTADARQVILCNQVGEPTGTSDIVSAHQDDGQLHLAFSVFVFRQTDKGLEVLIQQRSEHKILFAGHWANTCCSHLAPDDKNICEVGQRRLKEECGFTVPLQVAGTFVYRASDSRAGGTEYEHDTVLVGHASADVQVQTDPSEIADYKWVTPHQLRNAFEQNEADFAPWFRPALEYAVSRISGPTIPAA